MRPDADAPSLLRFLCAGDQGPDTVETYVLHLDPDAETPAGQLNRINGMPVGVTDERWPVDEDGWRYAHVCTLDLATMPALAALEPGVRAAVLFVCDPARDGGGDDPHFVHRWVMLSDEEVARGSSPRPACRRGSGRTTRRGGLSVSSRTACRAPSSPDSGRKTGG